MGRKANQKKQNKQTNTKSSFIRSQNDFVNAKPIYYIFSALAIIVIGFLIYSNSFDTEYYFDDFHAIVNKTDIRDVDNYTDLSNWTHVTNNRSLAYLTFALNYKWGELDPFGFRLFNVFIHIFGALATFWLIFLTLRMPGVQNEKLKQYTHIIAGIGALIFLTHPIMTQAVTYTVQRMTSMAALFYILSVALYARGRLFMIFENKMNFAILCFAGTFVSMMLGMWSKELLYTLPLMLWVYELFFIRDKENKINTKYLAVFGVLLIAALLYQIFGIWSGVLPRETREITRIDYLMTQFSVFIKYIQLLFVPINQILDYDYKIAHSFLELRTLLSFAGLIALFGAGVALFKKYRVLSFFIFWFFITLAIESSIFPIIDVIFEHRLYLPMFGFAMFLAAVPFYFIKKEHAKYVIYAFMALIVVYSYATFQRNYDWKTGVTLWSDNVEKNQKPRAYYERGNTYNLNQRFDLAIKDYNMALFLKPRYAEAFNNRGYAYNNLGKNQRAIADFKNALSIFPDYADALLNIGVAYSNLQQFDKAFPNFDRLVALRPPGKLIQALNGRGVCLINLNKPQEAINDFTAIINADPNNVAAYSNRGFCYINMEKWDQAMADLNKALSINPNFVDAYKHLGNMYFRRQMYPEAITYFEKALEIVPTNGEFLFNKAVSLYWNRQYNEAWTVLDQAIKNGYPVTQGQIDSFRQALNQ